jgi:hypothetical protein
MYRLDSLPAAIRGRGMPEQQHRGSGGHNQDDYRCSDYHSGAVNLFAGPWWRVRATKIFTGHQRPSLYDQFFDVHKDCLNHGLILPTTRMSYYESSVYRIYRCRH